MAIKTAALNKSQILTFINNFLANFQTLGNLGKDPEISLLDKHFAKNFQLSSNGKILTRSINDYFARLKYLREKYSHFDIVGPLEEPLVSDNHFSIFYELDLQGRDGVNRQVYIMAQGTIEDNKVSKWVQLTHEKGSSTWDK